MAPSTTTITTPTTRTSMAPSTTTITTPTTTASMAPSTTTITPSTTTTSATTTMVKAQRLHRLEEELFYDEIKAKKEYLRKGGRERSGNRIRMKWVSLAETGGAKIFFRPFEMIKLMKKLLPSFDLSRYRC